MQRYASSTTRSIPSLDGLRAVSVMLVICGHANYRFLDALPHGIFKNGILGVDVFFAISGFLITHLLIREADRTGKINLKNFYLRRAFRIFPPFYAYLAVIAVLGALHLVRVSVRSLLIAATYTWNYTFHPETWVLGHLWSLCVEEQFYLLWPLCLVLFSRKTALKIALALVVCSPLIRVATYATLPAYRGYTGSMLHTKADALMVGCIIALATDLNALRRLRMFMGSLPALVASLLVLFFVSPWLQMRFEGKYLLPVGMTLESLGCAAILLYAMSNSRSLTGRFLNLPLLRHIGTISYSIYLWQQLFTGPYTKPLPITLLSIFVCAEASFWLIEKPSFRLRDRFIHNMRNSVRDPDQAIV